MRSFYTRMASLFAALFTTIGFVFVGLGVYAAIQPRAEPEGFDFLGSQHSPLVTGLAYLPWAASFLFAGASIGVLVDISSNLARAAEQRSR